MGYDRTPIPRRDLDRLIQGLDVNFVRLADCYVSQGYELAFAPLDAPALHHVLWGDGWLHVGERQSIALVPHTVVVVPAGAPFRISVTSQAFCQVKAKLDQSVGPGGVEKHVAGDGEPQIHLICGYFKAGYSIGINPFASLGGPLVERFDEHQSPTPLLKAAMAESVADEAGAATMTGLLLKQLLILLFRRSLASADDWGARFSALGDPRIARAFSEMLARPGAPHTVMSLASHASLSRSAFQARFLALFGMTPMSALRQLRMKHAMTLLAGGVLSVEQVAREVGYASRSSFIRAYQELLGVYPVAGQPKL